MKMKVSLVYDKEAKKYIYEAETDEEPSPVVDIKGRPSGKKEYRQLERRCLEFVTLVEGLVKEQLVVEEVKAEEIE